MKVTVDETLCSGCSVVEEMASPTCSKWTDAGVVAVKVNPIPEDLQESTQEAADGCPSGAILDRSLANNCAGGHPHQIGGWRHCSALTPQRLACIYPAGRFLSRAGTCVAEYCDHCASLAETIEIVLSCARCADSVLVRNFCLFCEDLRTHIRPCPALSSVLICVFLLASTGWQADGMTKNEAAAGGRGSEPLSPGPRKRLSNRCKRS